MSVLQIVCISYVRVCRNGEWMKRLMFVIRALTAVLHTYLIHMNCYTGLSKKMDGIWNRYNLKSTGRIYTFGVLKCSEKFKVLDLL